MVNFDEVINRVDSDSFKWDAANRALGSNDYIQMGCADMDFKAPVEIIEELKKAVEFGIFGYVTQSKTFEEGIIKWYQERHGVEIGKQSIVYSPKVVIAASLCVEAFSRPGDSIILNSPYYPPLDEVSLANGRRVIEPPLEEREGRYVMNLEKLETMIDSKTKIMILVSPHNPTTRIWTQEELEQIADFCVRHKIILFVDEIHSDFVKSGHKFISMAAIKGPIQDLLVLANAPSKTFNLAGLVGSYHIIYNSWLRERVEKESSLSHYNEMNVLSMYALMGAYREEGHVWVDELCQVLSENIAYACNFIKEHFPEVKVARPQGTYMLFLDCSRWCETYGKTLDEVLKAGWDVGVAWQDGRPFHGCCHIRMNLALPLTRVQEAFARLKNYVFTIEE